MKEKDVKNHQYKGSIYKEKVSKPQAVGAYKKHLGNIKERYDYIYFYTLHCTFLLMVLCYLT